MNIELLGELSPDPTIEEWWVSGEVYVGYFPNTPLRFVVEDLQSDTAPAEFTSAIKNFLGLTLADRTEATPYVFRNYTEFVEATGEEKFIDTPADVWNHVYPSVIHVLRRAYGDKNIYVSIGANCDWEEEHGLQIVYREGKQLNRVSDQDGHVTHADAYDLPEREDRIC